MEATSAIIVSHLRLKIRTVAKNQASLEIPSFNIFNSYEDLSVDRFFSDTVPNARQNGLPELVIRDLQKIESCIKDFNFTPSNPQKDLLSSAKAVPYEAPSFLFTLRDEFKEARNLHRESLYTPSELPGLYWRAVRVGVKNWLARKSTEISERKKLPPRPK